MQNYQLTAFFKKNEDGSVFPAAATTLLPLRKPVPKNLSDKEWKHAHAKRLPLHKSRSTLEHKTVKDLVKTRGLQKWYMGHCSGCNDYCRVSSLTLKCEKCLRFRYEVKPEIDYEKVIRELSVKEQEKLNRAAAREEAGYESD